MSNKGKDLENYVRTIYKELLPPGFVITTRVKEQNNDGVQVNEFDIVIEGILFTKKCRWLIECRNRPSQGAASRAWIEQLIGRRQANNFDFVTAVSTTGFSPGATELANRERIGLDQVTTLEPEPLLSWFKKAQIEFNRFKFNLLHAQLFTPESSDKTTKMVLDHFGEINVNSKIFRLESSSHSISLKDAFDNSINRTDELWKLADEKNVSKKLYFDVNYPDDNPRYKLDIPDTDIEVVQIVFIADFKIEKTIIPAQLITQYSSSDKDAIIAESVQFPITIDDKTIELSIHKITEDNQVKIFATQKLIDI